MPQQQSIKETVNVRIKAFENDDGSYTARCSGMFLEDPSKVPGAVKIVPGEVVTINKDHPIFKKPKKMNRLLEVTMEESTRPLTFEDMQEAAHAKKAHAAGFPSHKWVEEDDEDE